MLTKNTIYIYNENKISEVKLLSYILSVTAHILLAKSQFQEFSQRLYWAVEVFEEILPVKYEQLLLSLLLFINFPNANSGETDTTKQQPPPSLQSAFNAIEDLTVQEVFNYWHTYNKPRENIEDQMAQLSINSQSYHSPISQDEKNIRHFLMVLFMSNLFEDENYDTPTTNLLGIFTNTLEVSINNGRSHITIGEIFPIHNLLQKTQLKPNNHFSSNNTSYQLLWFAIFSMCCITAYAAETGDKEPELSYAIQRLKEYNPAIELLSNNQVSAIEAVTALNEAIKDASSPSKWTFIVPLVCGGIGGFTLNCLHQCCVNKMIQSTRKKIESTKSKVVTFIQSRHTSLEDIPHQDEKAQSSKIDTQQKQSSSCGMSCPSFFTLCKCQKKSDEAPSSKQVDTDTEPERQW